MQLIEKTINFLLDLGIIIGPSIGYAFQYVEIDSRGEVEAFSPFVVFILVVANTLRLVFWFGVQFEFALLCQSMLILFTQFFLIELVARLQRRKKLELVEERQKQQEDGENDRDEENTACCNMHSHTNNECKTKQNKLKRVKEDEGDDAEVRQVDDTAADSNTINRGEVPNDTNNISLSSSSNCASSSRCEYMKLKLMNSILIAERSCCDFEWFKQILNCKIFWQWDYFLSYLSVSVIFFFVWFFIAAAINSKEVYDIIGYVALGIEAALPIPQLIRICAMRCTYGVNFVMIASWFFGDIFKTVYFFVRSSPLQFRACGCVQLAEDFLIVLQFCYFPNSRQNERLNDNFELSRNAHSQLKLSTSASSFKDYNDKYCCSESKQNNSSNTATNEIEVKGNLNINEQMKSSLTFTHP